MTTIKQPNPVAIPAGTQSLDLIASRMTDARRELLAAINSDQVTWHRPPGTATPRTLVHKPGERGAKAVTGEVNWLRSHELAVLGAPSTNKSTGITRPVRLTERGAALLEVLS